MERGKKRKEKKGNRDPDGGRASENVTTFTHSYKILSCANERTETERRDRQASPPDIVDTRRVRCPARPTRCTSLEIEDVEMATAQSPEEYYDAYLRNPKDPPYKDLPLEQRIEINKQRLQEKQQQKPAPGTIQPPLQPVPVLH